MNKPFTIGITGGSGSGKTYFLQGLSSHFKPEEICLISQDNYYKPLDQQPIDENGVENFDLPVSIDRDAFQNDLLKLKSGQNVAKKEYTFNNNTAVPKLLQFNTAPILVVEGLFVQYFEEIDKELDLKIIIGLYNSLFRIRATKVLIWSNFASHALIFQMIVLKVIQSIF